MKCSNKGKNNVNSSFKVESTIESIYTGGKVDLVDDFLLTTAGDAVNILDLNDSTRREIKDDSLVTCFATTKDRIIIAFQNQLLKTFDFELQELKSYKVHEAPVLVMDTKSSLVATGSADSTVKCWDIEKGHCTHNFKGHAGIVSALKFHPSKLILASGSDDCKIRVWDLKKKSYLWANLDAWQYWIRMYLSFEDYHFLEITCSVEVEIKCSTNGIWITLRLCSLLQHLSRLKHLKLCSLTMPWLYVRQANLV